MQVIIYFLNGNNETIENHYAQKDYRDDIIIEIDGAFYEVYFFVESVLGYEMRKDGFFSFPGLIILDEISNIKIFNAIEKLIDLKFFECFVAKDKFSPNHRFLNKWYLNEINYKSSETLSTFRLR